MKTLRFSFALCTVVLFTSACAQPGGLFGPTVTPTPTLTPSPTPTPSPQEILAGGWAALTGDDLETAEEIADQVLERDEENGEAWALKGHISTARENISQSIEQLEQARTLGYETEELLSQLEQAYIQQNDALLQEAHTIWDPDLIAANINQARAHLASLRQLNPKAVLIQEDYTLLETEPLDAADVSVYDDTAVSFYEEAEEHFGNSQFSLAITAYQNALEIEPDFHIARLYLGDVYYVQEQFQESIPYFQGVVERNSAIIQGWSFLGDSYRNLQLPEHARFAYIRALMLDEEDQLALDGLGRIFQPMRQWDAALFSSYDFRLNIPSTAQLEFFELNDELSTKNGFVVIQNERYTIWLLWQTRNSEEIVNEDSLYELLEFFNQSIQDVTFLGEKKSFLYGEVPMVYQVYHYAPDPDTNNGGGHGIWTCPNRLFQFQIEFTDITKEAIPLKIPRLFAPYLESFRCEPDLIP